MGEKMNNRMKVFDIDIDNFTAKEAMKHFVEFMQSEPVNVIRFVTADSLMRIEDVPGLKEQVSNFDVVIAGDTTVLESAAVTEKKYLREIKDQVLLKMIFRYISRNHKRVYLLVESEKEGQEFFDYFEHCHRGMQIAGMARVSAENRADDMIVNAMNGADIDCVISVLSSPLQEDLIIKNKSLLNANVWIGIGKECIPTDRSGRLQERVAQFLIKKIFQKELEKKKKNEADMASAIK